MKSKLIAILALALLSLWAMPAFAQDTKTVTGVVTEVDEAGRPQPLAGVGVFVDGGKTATMTDVDGRYEISARSSDEILFSMLGYEEQRFQVGGRSRIDVVMKQAAEFLEELVFVGYGSVRKSDIVSSVASVSVEDSKRFPSVSATEMIRGAVPGVTVRSSSGAPGSVPSIVIRGSRSISAGNNPLYIIDGSVATETEFAMINAEDVESIEVLKDASSQAIYGARASDGVVLVTTKRGKAGKAEISYNGYVGIQSLWRNFDFYNADEWVALRREAKAHGIGYIDANKLSLTQAIDDEMMTQAYVEGKFVDWESLMMKKAPVMHNHQLGVRGGTDKLKASVSIGYLNQDGLVLNSGYERLTGRLNVDFNVTKWLSIGANTSYGWTNKRTANGSFYQYITRTPLATIYEADGSYTKYINSSLDVNPLYKAQEDTRETKGYNYRINAFVDIKPFKGFSYRLNASYYNRTTEEGRARTSKYPGGGATASLNNSTTIRRLLENIINYTVPIRNKNHRLSITAMQSFDYSRSQGLSYATGNLPVDKGYNYIANGEITAYDREYSESRLISFMGRVQYSYGDRYLLNVAYRRDGSSKFGANSKWGDFPSVAVAWKINKEKFMSRAKWVDDLKLRASYGIVGNQSGIGSYTTLGVSKPYPGEFGDSYYLGYLPSSTLSNPNLKWEQSATLNTALDFGFLDRRIKGTVEYYYTWTTNLLVTRSLNSVLGYTEMLDNLGETRTSGVDLNISADIVRSRDINLGMSFNFSHFRNHIVKIDNNVDADGKPVSQPGNGWIIGSPINVYYNYKFDGIYQYDEFEITRDILDPEKLHYALLPTVDTNGDGIPDAALSRTDVVEPGDVKIKDVNGDGKIDEKDRVVYSKDPDFVMSWNTNFDFYGFDFHMEWYASVGGYVLNPLLYDGEYGGNLRGITNGMKVDYWTPYKPSANYPRPRFDADIKYLQTLAYQDASYLRLRTLSLGYTLPKKVLHACRAEKMRLYFTASNLLTFTKVLSYSPEVLGSSYPEARQFVFGVNLTF